MSTPRQVFLGTALIAIALIVTFGDLPGRWLFVGELQNGAHAPAFVFIALLLVALSRRLPLRSNWSPLTRYIAVVVTSTAIGAAIEVIQGVLHRDMSFVDVFHDFLGALIGVGVMHSFRWEPSTNALRRSSVMLACLALAAAAFPIAWSAAAYIHRDREFPVVLQFGSQLDRYFLFDCAARDDLTYVENSRLLVKLEPECDRQIGLGEPYPDWTGYTHLNVDIANTTITASRFTIRIEDVEHNQEYTDRFNQTFSLAAKERKTLTIPLEVLRNAPATRKMDMKQIYWIEIFASEDTTGPAAVALYRMWLDKN